MRTLMALIAAVTSQLAFAQNATPLTGEQIFVTEFSRNVSLSWSEMNWSGYSPLEMKWTRSEKGELLTNPKSGNSVYVDTDTFHNYQLRGGDTKHGETKNLISTRNGQALGTGATWNADHSYKTYSASWCHEDKANIDSKFEVGAKEQYQLVVHGKDMTIDVFPIVESGWWNRCYSGKRYSRYLVSKDLDAIVSIEHVGYTPNGQTHESSYRINVKEIKTP